MKEAFGSWKAMLDSPEKGQILGELDDLLHHESIDICKVCEQRQHGGQRLESPVMGEQVSRRL